MVQADDCAGALNVRWPLACGVVAGPLFVVTFLVAGTIPAGYDPLRHPVSSLAIGDLGWIQTVSFIVTGGLLLVFAAGLWPLVQPLGGSRWGAILIGIVALGFLGAGIFTANPRSGYPPGAAIAPWVHDDRSHPRPLRIPRVCRAAERVLCLRPLVRPAPRARLDGLLGGERRRDAGRVHTRRARLRADGGLRRGRRLVSADLTRGWLGLARAARDPRARRFSAIVPARWVSVRARWLSGGRGRHYATCKLRFPAPAGRGRRRGLRPECRPGSTPCRSRRRSAARPGPWRCGAAG